MDSVRTCRRCQLRFEDLKVGMKVRIMHDLEYVEAQCEKAAPGAEDAVLWRVLGKVAPGGLALLTGIEPYELTLDGRTRAADSGINLKLTLY